MNASLRAVVVAVVAVPLGVILGALFVPDPTSPTAFALGGVGAVAVGALLYRSEWLREG
jgi:hypothetical protein